MLKLLKKGAAQAKQAKGQAAGVKGRRKAAGPRERKIGIFGHTRAGKTVFLTMLWHKTHGRRDFSLETDDFQTRQDMSSYFDLLAAGQWPPPTATERLYRFTAVIDTTIRYPFESQDYQGESASIDREVETGKSFLEYFESCDAVFVLVDAEDLIVEGRDASAKRRKKIDSFELMLAQLVEGTRNRLRIPVAVVVTKADLLDGFQGEDHVVLVGDTIRYSRYRGYDSFVAAVLQQAHVARHLPWRDQVERTLLMLKPLIDYCLTKSPDLQVFFISSTGGVERTPAGEVRPPRELRPIGLEQPFVWSVHLLMEKRRALIARRIKWWVAGAAAIFILFFSLANVWHEARIQRIRKLAGLGGVGGGTAVEKVDALESYRSNLLAGFFRPEFRETVGLILEYEQARALSARMREAVASLSFEEFSEARRAMREVRDRFPTASQEYRSCDETLARRENEWDRAFAEQKLQPLLAGARLASTEIEPAIQQLFRPENQTEWQNRWRQRRSGTMSDLRGQDLDQIQRGVSGLGGRSWSALERIKELCQTYVDAYADDLQDTGEWRTAYVNLREITGLIDRAVQAQDNPDELAGIAAQLRSVGPVSGQAIGARIAGHLGGLGQEMVAAGAGEELDRLVQDMEGSGFGYRFEEAFKGRLQRFARDYPGTPEAQRVQRFLSRLATVESGGLLVKVEASECPAGHHLRVWNAETSSWDPSEIEPGLPGRLRWKPGDTLKFGIEKTDPRNPGNKIIDEWEVTGRWALFQVQEEGGRHLFRGNLPVTISFPDLATALPGL